MTDNHQEKISDKLFTHVSYSKGAYSKSNSDEQWVRLSDGCPNNCEYCYCPTDMETYPIPNIERNTVKIMDMNLLSQPNAKDIIKELAKIKVNNKVVYYELICGIDYRFLTQEIAILLHSARFKNIRFAWDYSITNQYKMKDVFMTLIFAGYNPKDIMVFMVCNWKIPYKECMQKLDILKVWGCKVSDCYYDNQTMPNVHPIYWKPEEIRAFRKVCRKHNQLIIFRLDPEIKQLKQPIDKA